MRTRAYDILCRALASLALVACLAHPRSGEASGQPFLVDSTLDEVDDLPGDGACHTASNACTLRAAAMEAVRVPVNDPVIVLQAATYTLTIAPGQLGAEDGPLELTPLENNPIISFIGKGAGKTIIDIGAATRAFTVFRTVRLVGLTIRNGKVATPSTSGAGGAILNVGVGGNLLIDGCSLEDNEATGSGGAAGYGGAIYNTGTLEIRRSRLIGNRASVRGGAIWSGTGTATLVVRDSTISGNGSAGPGGGISNESQLTVVQSTISNNQAGTEGGGIHNTSTANVYNTTIANNQADLDGGAADFGAGVFNDSNFNFRNTVFAGNIRPPSTYDDCAGTVNAYGRNAVYAVDGASCDLVETPPFLGVTVIQSLAELGALQDNGGPTLTQALVPPTAMIDNADPEQGCIDELAGFLVLDQRGYPRIAGGSCDLGAIEYGAPGGQPLSEDGFESSAPVLVINEVDYDQPGNDTGEFVEIRNNGEDSVNLSGYALVLVNGSTNAEYARVDLGPAGVLPSGGYLVVRSAGVVVAPSARVIDFPGVLDRVQNGAADGVALIQVSPPQLVDALSYEGSITAAQIGGFAGTVSLVEGTALSVPDTDVAPGSLCRYPDGTDTNNASSDWALRGVTTPGLANQ